ncbi:serine hydrolase domain-containing protein [Limosilactobacillus alvi]
MQIQTKYQKTLKLLTNMRINKVVPALSYLIFEGNQRLKVETGWAKITPELEPLRPGMFYDLASLTKVIGTLPAIAQLVQAGKLNWDDQVKTFLPELKGKNATIRDLLTHTAAIEGYIPHRNELNHAELLQAILNTESFGENLAKNICYTDLGLILVGLIAEKVTGKPIQELVTETVIQPLGLTNELSYHPPVQGTVPTELSKKRGLIRGTVHDPKAFVLQEQCGSAGLFGTLTGLERYAHELLENNLGGLLTTTMIQSFFHDQTRMQGMHNRSFGWKLFLSRGKDRHSVISHTGFTGTFMILDQQTDQGLIVLTNRVHPTAKNDRFLELRDQIIASYLNEKEKS